MPHVPAGEKRPLLAIEAAEAWARGDPGITLQMVLDAAADAHAAYAYTHAAAYAADAAAYAAAAAHAAYAAAYYAADAAAYAAADAHADTDANADDTRKQRLAQCADIVRKHYPHPPEQGGKNDTGKTAA